MSLDDLPDLVESLDQVVSEPKSSYSPQIAAKPLQLEPESQESSKTANKKIPITIVTGYLGSGKSTLLDYIGKTTNQRLAIILNEFGDSSLIEKSVTIKDNEKNETVQEWLDLGNGCLCCSVKDNGVTAIENLIENSRDKVDYILLETTGIADPAPIARMFWLDDGLSSSVYIDGVVTVVDSENILKCLDDVGGHWHRENKYLKQFQAVEDVEEEDILEEQALLNEGITTAHLQIAMADAILINKVDKIEDNLEARLEELKTRLSTINSTCPIYPTKFGDIDLTKVLNLHSYEANASKIADITSSKGMESFHDDRIKTVTLSFPFLKHDKFDSIELFIQSVLWEKTVLGSPVEIHRLKGIIVRIMDDGEYDARVVQGVRETYDIINGAKLIEGINENKLVFIGKGLNTKDLMNELNKYT